MTPGPESAPAVALWDLPVRAIHWAFVLLLPVLWWTGEEGEIELHKTIGIVMLGLLIFRILWGFVGSSTARFANFLRGPAAVLGDLRNTASGPVVGHNPVGGWSVVALLLVLLAQVAFGLFAQDVDGIESGPLSYLVDYDSADAAREWHHLVFNVILGLVALHVIAILYYLFRRRDNLIAPMISGRRTFAEPVEAPRLAPAWRVAACAAVAGAVAWWVSLGAPLPGSA